LGNCISGVKKITVNLPDSNPVGHNVEEHYRGNMPKPTNFAKLRLLC